jgi:hypothetical protein
MISELTGTDINEKALLKDNGVVIGGWGNAGITYNAANPANNFNGPVTFGDRASEVQLNQLNLFIQRAVATEGTGWDFGGRFDVMFGTDAIFTQAYGVPAFDINSGLPLRRNDWDLNMLNSGSDNRFYDLALPQAFIEAYAPIGNGLNIKAGHFYTPIGYETVPAPDNFFYTHAYTMQYGEPFTHTGVMLNYAVNANWSAMAGATTASATGGWDGGWDRQLGNWGGFGGVTWTSDDKGTSLNVAGTFAAASEKSDKAFALYSIVFKHNLNDKTHLMLQHDHGFADGIAMVTDAEWYGINMHLTYDVKDNLTAGIRTEWFRDQNGFRVCSPGRIAASLDNTGYTYAGGISNFNPAVSNTCNAASYYAITGGLNWKPVAWLNVRPNVRYDWVDGTVAGGGHYRPFGNAKQDQFLFSTDFSVTF